MASLSIQNRYPLHVTLTNKLLVQALRDKAADYDRATYMHECDQTPEQADAYERDVLTAISMCGLWGDGPMRDLRLSPQLTSLVLQTALDLNLPSRATAALYNTLGLLEPHNPNGWEWSSRTGRMKPSKPECTIGGKPMDINYDRFYAARDTGQLF